MGSIKIFRFKTFRVGFIDKKLSSLSLFIIYMLKIVFCIDISTEYISVEIFNWKHSVIPSDYRHVIISPSATNC